jgi:hypothetical protein
MNKKTTLKEALEAWVEWRLAQEEREPPSPAELYEFLRQPGNSAYRTPILALLDQSAASLRELGEMARSRTVAHERLGDWDIALPKAAATSAEGSGKITSEGGKYTIEIRPHLAQADRGIVVVRVALAHREALEGKVLILKDSSGQVLLRGKVVDGEVSQEIEGLSRIEYGFVVQTAGEEG